MGLVYADIKLTNVGDMEMLRRNYLKPKDIRTLNVTAMVDCGAYMLTINQTIKAQLGLEMVDTQQATLADGQVIELDVVGPIEVRFANRRTVCEAVVLPGEADVLLGAIPMEAMDVVILPREQKLIVKPAHPYKPQLSLK